MLKKRVFACKDRRRYSRKRAKFCRKFAKNWQLPYGSTTLRDPVVEVRRLPAGLLHAQLRRELVAVAHHGAQREAPLAYVGTYLILILSSSLFSSPIFFVYTSHDSCFEKS